MQAADSFVILKKALKYRGFLFRLAFAIAVGLLISHFSLDPIEYFFYDLRVRTKVPSRPTGHIELVTTTQETIKHFQKLPSITEHTQLLRQILAEKPNAVVYVLNLDNLSGSKAEKDEFAKVAAGFADIYQASDQLEFKDQAQGRVKLKAPLDQIRVVPGPKTSDSSSFARDSVTRRLLVSYEDQELLHVALAKRFNPAIADPHNIRGTFDWYGSVQTMIDFAPWHSYPDTDLATVLSLPASDHRFTDKIVIIGDDTELEKRDYVFTPFSRNDANMSLAELHANIFDTLIRNSAPVKAPQGVSIWLTILIAIFTVEVVLTMKPLKGIAVLLSLTAAYSLTSFLAFWPFGLWTEMAHPFLAIFLCYYFFIPYRLIVESRRSWEYFQKHKLLSEVEQLKTNFIGMMSHDLKTPLARIQGMVDVIQKDANPISSHQREALDTIKQSGEDLLRFISTILNYAQIESQGVVLHLQSRDINEILKEVVKKHEFLARLKHIQLISELEPLFSTKVDPELLRQVFSNLVENAIKYSPENSRVLISSEEVDGKIIVQVADQGMGIATEDIPNIFMKFFRSKNAKSSPMKGSGLGLYLAKYFVELHQGRIICESTPGQGSTFTVELPIQS
jgi:signal transduction histidine kinase